MDPKVGSMNGDVPSRGRAPLPLPHLEPMKDKEALEKPFKVHFSGRQVSLIITIIKLYIHFIMKYLNLSHWLKYQEAFILSFIKSRMQIQ